MDGGHKSRDGSSSEMHTDRILLRPCRLGLGALHCCRCGSILQTTTPINCLGPKLRCCCCFYVCSHAQWLLPPAFHVFIVILFWRVAIDLFNEDGWGYSRVIKVGYCACLPSSIVLPLMVFFYLRVKRRSICSVFESQN